MIWSTSKCTELQPENYPTEEPFMLAGKKFKTDTSSKYLCVTVTYNGVSEKQNETRIVEAIREKLILSATGMHDGNLTSENLLQL